MDEIDIFTVTEAFAHAAKRAKSAGFDGVQIHAAHGYLLSEFLSGYYNQRQDSYGGSVEKRARFLYEVLAMVRGEVGEDYPVTVKINAEDFVEGGFSHYECVLLCDQLAKRSIDAIELSGGIPAADLDYTTIRVQDPSETDPVYYEEDAQRVRKTLNVPIILVGGIRYLHKIERLLENKCCDMVALSRPLIREPDLVRRWAGGNTDRAACISCNLCMRPILTGRGMYCPAAIKKPHTPSTEEQE